MTLLHVAPARSCSVGSPGVVGSPVLLVFTTGNSFLPLSSYSAGCNVPPDRSLCLSPEALQQQL